MKSWKEEFCKMMTHFEKKKIKIIQWFAYWRAILITKAKEQQQKKQQTITVKVVILVSWSVINDEKKVPRNANESSPRNRVGVGQNHHPFMQSHRHDHAFKTWISHSNRAPIIYFNCVHTPNIAISDTLFPVLPTPLPFKSQSNLPLDLTTWNNLIEVLSESEKTDISI